MTSRFPCSICGHHSTARCNCQNISKLFCDADFIKHQLNQPSLLHMPELIYISNIKKSKEEVLRKCRDFEEDCNSIEENSKNSVNNILKKGKNSLLDNLKKLRKRKYANRRLMESIYKINELPAFGPLTPEEELVKKIYENPSYISNE